MIRLFPEGWRKRRHVGPPTLVAVTALEWPTETQAGDLAVLLVESEKAPQGLAGWTLVRERRPYWLFYQIVRFARRSLGLKVPHQLWVFRNASLL